MEKPNYNETKSNYAMVWDSLILISKTLKTHINNMLCDFNSDEHRMEQLTEYISRLVPARTREEQTAAYWSNRMAEFSSKTEEKSDIRGVFDIISENKPLFMFYWSRGINAKVKDNLMAENRSLHRYNLVLNLKSARNTSAHPGDEDLAFETTFVYVSSAIDLAVQIGSEETVGKLGEIMINLMKYNPYTQNDIRSTRARMESQEKMLQDLLDSIRENTAATRSINTTIKGISRQDESFENAMDNLEDLSDEQLEKLVAAESTVAKHILGKRLWKSKDPKENSRGKKLVEESAKAGNIPALATLGQILFFGKEYKEKSLHKGIIVLADLNKDRKNNRRLGFEYLRNAALKGDNKAKALMSIILLGETEYKDELDKPLGLQYLRESSEAGDELAISARLLYFGYKRGFDFASAAELRWVKQQADRGNPQALYGLGIREWLWKEEWGTNESFDKEELIKSSRSKQKSDESSDSIVNSIINTWRSRPIGPHEIELDIAIENNEAEINEEAVYYMNLARFYGSEEASFWLARQIMDDKLPAAPYEVIKLMDECTDKGMIDAYIPAAKIFLNGKYVEENVEKAIFWLNKALVLDSQEAFDILVDLYLNGFKSESCSMEPDVDRALALFGRTRLNPEKYGLTPTKQESIDYANWVHNQNNESHMFLLDVSVSAYKTAKAILLGTNCEKNEEGATKWLEEISGADCRYGTWELHEMDSLVMTEEDLQKHGDCVKRINDSLNTILIPSDDEVVEKEGQTPTYIDRIILYWDLRRGTPSIEYAKQYGELLFQENSEEVCYTLAKYYNDRHDYRNAFPWMVLAALPDEYKDFPGNPEAQYYVGYYYRQGEDHAVSKNLESSRLWLDLAAKNGHKKAASMLKKLNNARE